MTPSPAPEISHRILDVNGIRMHIAEAGEGPPVVLLHGFPEGWYSWRHQIAALAGAGYHAIAPDQRGYGRTDQPEPIEAYSILHLVGDAVGLIDALGEGPAFVVGHDWGGPVAWQTALFRPDLVRGIAGLSVPYRPRGSRPPLDVYREYLGDGFYQVYFQASGVAEAELEGDIRRSIRVTLSGASGEAPSVPTMMVGDDGLLGSIQDPGALPPWLTEADLDHWEAEFARSGFRGGLNWYRNIDRNWQLTAPWQGAAVTVPALYMVGDRDLVYHFPGGRQAAENLKASVPNLTRTIILDGCGHWTQQERPAEVNAALLGFFEEVGARS